MVLRILSGGAIAALAGAAMLAASSGPSPAFTLSSPSLEQPVAARRRSSPLYWRHWRLARRLASRMGLASRLGLAWRLASLGLGPAGGGPRYAMAWTGWRCWWTPWGYRRCGWV